MAEAAVVEEQAAVPTRFYCHMCNVEINIPNTDFTCPLCAGGFVEELPAAAAHPPSSTASGGGGGGSQRESVVSFGSQDSGGSLGDALGFNRFSDLDTLRGEIATLLMSRNGPNVEISIDGGPSGTRRGNLLTLGGGGSSSSGTSLGGAGGGASGGTGGGRVRPQNLDRLDNVLLDFLQSISGGDAETFGNSQMFFMGNPGDYAWGREGIDTIVTQLLNQMETSGPPPLAKDKIAEIPKVEITADEVERKMQCSVCWEDFRVQEIVRKLPCSHIYHENCIVPWLDLHGTCPICRKSLTDDNDVGAADAGGGGMMMPPQRVCPLHRRGGGGVAAGGGNPNNAAATSTSAAAVSNNAAASAANGGGSGGGSSTSQTQTQQNQTRNNIFAFDDGNVDLD